jgi:hypothetical protein
MNEMSIIILSVHYKYPGLLRDQWERIRGCAEPTRKSLNAELRYHPVVHRGSTVEVVAAAYAVGEGDGLLSSCIHLRATPESSASAHGDSLAAALLELTRTGSVRDEDLIAVMDHDAHPVDADLFAAVGERLLRRNAPAGIGIPQWHRGHCYLHPSFLIARAGLIRQMGPETAFKVRMVPGDRVPFWDVCEGFTIWCEDNGRAILPLRVNATRFPWSRWDSDMVPDGGAELTGEHGERVQIGNLMLYGLGEERSLVSHVWAAPLREHSRLARLKRWLTRSRPGLACEYNEREVLSAYLAEPQASGWRPENSARNDNGRSG